MRRAIPTLLLILSVSGCANAYTTTVVTTDGERFQAMPRCVTDINGDETLWGEGIEEGIPRADVARLTSHSGLELTVITAALVAGGVGLIVSGLTDQQRSGELRIALGGAVGGTALAGLIAGSLLLASSAGSLGRECSVRSRWFREAS